MCIGPFHWGRRTKGRPFILILLPFLIHCSGNLVLGYYDSALSSGGSGTRRIFQYPWKTGATLCYSCPSGNFSDHEGSPICEACSPGACDAERERGAYSCPVFDNLLCRNLRSIQWLPRLPSLPCWNLQQHVWSFIVPDVLLRTAAWDVNMPSMGSK